MSKPSDQIRLFLEQERRDLARFERGTRWLTGAVVAGWIVYLVVLGLGCTSLASYPYDESDTAHRTADDVDLDSWTADGPEESASDSAESTENTETTVGNTDSEVIPVATDTGAPPDTGGNPPTDTPVDTGPDLPSATGPATEAPDPTSSGPDTGSGVPTTEPEPTGEPDPTVDTTSNPDPACADGCCHVANGLRWRAPYWFAADGYYMWLGQNSDVPDGNICDEMAAAGDCGITTWRLPTRCEWNEEVVTRHPDPDAPCACTIAWDKPDPTTQSGTESGVCFKEGWTVHRTTGENSIGVRCAGEPTNCPLASWTIPWKLGAHILCVADPD